MSEILTWRNDKSKKNNKKFKKWEKEMRQIENNQIYQELHLIQIHSFPKKTNTTYKTKITT